MITRRLVTLVAVVLTATACGGDSAETAAPNTTVAPTTTEATTTTAEPTTTTSTPTVAPTTTTEDAEPEDVPMYADDIPVAFTPAGGYGDTMPPPVLAGCTEPLSADAVDMRGLWSIVGPEDADGPAVQIGALQRIEQCGNRIVITSGGVVHDMRADGTFENGVNDVAAADFTTPVRVAATFEAGAHVLRPDGLPIEVTRFLDGEQLIWRYVGFSARLDRLGPPEMEPPGDDA